MKVHEAFEIVFLLAQRQLILIEDKQDQEKCSEALRVALEYYTSQYIDYSSPTRLPRSEVIRRRKAWRDALDSRTIPVPEWLRTFPCAGCLTIMDLDKLGDGYCELCRQNHKGE